MSAGGVLCFTLLVCLHSCILEIAGEENGSLGDLITGVFGQPPGYQGEGPRIDQPKYPGDRPNYPGDRPNFPGGQTNYPGDRPNFPGEQPNYPGDRPNFPGEQPNYPGDRPNFPGEQPNYPGDRPNFPGEQPNYPGDRPNYPGDRPNFNGGDRPNFPGEQPNYPGDHPNYSGEQPNYSGNNQPKHPNEEEDCECVPYYLCANGSIIEDGNGIIDIRLGASACDSYLDECCKTPPVTEPITPPPRKREGCGIRNVDGIGFRITGALDNEAQFGEFPWMIAILKEENVEEGSTLNVYLCGGSLIHPRVVLTAAHCVASKNLGQLKVRGGEWDTQTTAELYPHQDRRIHDVIIHEKFYKGGLHNDIALLILDEAFNAAHNLDIICLPHQGDVVLDRECLASGWGKDTYGKEGNYQVIMKRVELPMVSRGECEQAFKKTRLGQRFKLHESFVCAGGIPGKDTCKGDGGSPLVCPIRNGKEYQYQQVGIVAWGISCGDEIPAAYVNVAHFVDWIDKQMKRYNIHSDYYY